MVIAKIKKAVEKTTKKTVEKVTKVIKDNSEVLTIKYNEEVIKADASGENGIVEAILNHNPILIKTKVVLKYKNKEVVIQTFRARRMFKNKIIAEVVAKLLK